MSVAAGEETLRMELSAPGLTGAAGRVQRRQEGSAPRPREETALCAEEAEWLPEQVEQTQKLH